MDELDCSVVIPTFGRALSLESTLDCLGHQSLLRGRFEVIVVDNNSDLADSERVRAIAERQGANVVRADTRGPAAARNAGIRAARGRIVVFVDDDVEFESDFLEAHLAAHDDSASGIAIGPIAELNEHSRWFRRYLVDRRVVNRTPDPSALDYRNVYGANSSVHRGLLESIGGFDERFVRREDADLGLRMAAVGAGVVWASRASVRHRSSFGPLDHIKRSYWNGYYLAMLIEKHPEVEKIERMSNYGPRRRLVAAVLGPPALVVGAAISFITPALLHRGLTAMVLLQNGRGFKAYLKEAEDEPD